MFTSPDTYTSGIRPGHLRYKKTILHKLRHRMAMSINDGMNVDISGVEKFTSTGNDYVFDVINLVHRLEGKSRER